MQIMPDTAALYGVSREKLFDEDINIQVGLHYMRELLYLFNDRNLALAAYNCGPTRVIEAGRQIPMIRETRDYVRRVNRAVQRFKRKRI